MTVLGIYRLLKTKIFIWDQILDAKMPLNNFLETWFCSGPCLVTLFQSPFGIGLNSFQAIKNWGPYWIFFEGVGLVAPPPHTSSFSKKPKLNRVKSAISPPLNCCQLSRRSCWSGYNMLLLSLLLWLLFLLLFLFEGGNAAQWTVCVRNFLFVVPAD